MADNPNVTEDQVKAAAGSVAEAEKTARADKAAADKEAADKAAAKAVEDIVNALPDSAGLGDRDAVEAARAAYDALTDDQKKLVPEDVLARLATAERQVREAEDEAAAKKVTDTINALPDSAGLGDRDAVEAARAAYDALTEDQKKLVPEDALARLATAEQQVREAEDEARKVRITDCKITVKSQTYTGETLEPEVMVTYGEATLKKGTDYTVTYRDNVNPGTATATVKGKGDYTGSAEVTFAIRVPLSKCKLAVKDQAYTGKALEPAVTVKYGKATLKKGTDYTVTYKNNVKPGTATATVEGKGKYTGTLKGTFKITLKGTAFTKLTGGNRQITLHWNNQKNVTGYEIQYSLKKSFPDKKIVKIEKASTLTLTATIEELKANKTYYVRIRTYATIQKKNYYSAWSRAMTVNTEAGKAKNTSGIQPEEMEELTPGDLMDDGLLPVTGDIDGEAIVMDAA